ncbi:hypothetical protein CRENBAI_010252 [Crenichthys baileyi]|uniref:Uncharacterized protein n=1 Tax=Crenichthys baileyi TaxID=28760 RepID=A0AAV9RAY2_9TELE
MATLKSSSQSTTDIVLGRQLDEPGLSGEEISSTEHSSRAGTQRRAAAAKSTASFTVISAGRVQGERANRNSISQLCTNKLMNDNGLLIEGTGAIHPADCFSANGVLRVAMATGTERLWRSPDLSWHQIIFYT